MAGNAERTYLMIKPDGVQRGLAGKIIMRFEERGYKLVSAATHGANAALPAARSPPSKCSRASVNARGRRAESSRVYRGCHAAAAPLRRCCVQPLLRKSR